MALFSTVHWEVNTEETISTSMTTISINNLSSAHWDIMVGVSLLEVGCYPPPAVTVFYTEVKKSHATVKSVQYVVNIPLGG